MFTLVIEPMRAVGVARALNGSGGRDGRGPYEEAKNGFFPGAESPEVPSARKLIGGFRAQEGIVGSRVQSPTSTVQSEHTALSGQFRHSRKVVCLHGRRNLKRSIYDFSIF